MLKSRRNRVKKPLFVALGLLSASLGYAQGTWVDVTNGKDMTGLVKFGSGTVAFNTGGVIHVSGSNSYLRTEKEYTHFRTKFEWNNTDGSKNSGFLYHIVKDSIWPLGLECQTGLGDAGSLWTTRSKFNSTAASNGTTYSETGTAVTQFGSPTGRSHFIRSQNAYLSGGQWNTCELFVKNDSMEMKINNKVTMRIWKLTIKDTVPLVKGKIGLQIEGAELDFRNWQVMDLENTSAILPMKGEQGLSVANRPGYRLFIDPVARGNAVIASVTAGKPTGAFLDINGRHRDFFTQGFPLPNGN